MIEITAEMVAACANVLRDSGLIIPGSEALADNLAWECLDAARSAAIAKAKEG